MKLFIVRHGETDHNLQGRMQGRIDIPLNATGLAQAEALAERLADEGRSFDAIFASPMLRAKRTAEIIAAKLNMPVEFDADLVEVNMGIFENLTREEAEAKYPEVWAQNPLRRSIYDYIPEGESPQQVEERAMRAILRIKERFAEKTVLVVCHGFTARMINRHMMNLTFDEMHEFILKNCEMVEYDF